MAELTGLIVFKDPRPDARGRCASGRVSAAYSCSLDYLRARERAERAAAKGAQSVAARHVHQEMAQANSIAKVIFGYLSE